MLKSGKFGGLPNWMVTCHSKVQSRPVVAVMNKSLPIGKLLTDKDVAAVLLDLEEINVLVVSVYRSPEFEISSQLDLLQDLRDKHKETNIIAVDDFNDKSSVWGNPLH